MTADQYAFYAQIIPFFMLSILLSEREMWADNQHVSRSIATCYLLILGLGELIALIGIQWVLPNGMQFVVFASSVVGLIGVSILAFCMRFPKYQMGAALLE
jgi:hypothetical protein